MNIQAPADGVLFDILQTVLPDTTRTSLRKILRNERVRIDGQVVVRADTLVRMGQQIEIASGRAALARPPGPILFRDAHVLAIEKPPGMLSVSRDRPGEDTFYKRLQTFVQLSSGGRERVFIVHRLDRDASGIMLFALSAEIQERLQRRWESTEKRYWALVEGAPPQAAGTIRTWLRESKAGKVHSGPEEPDAKLAITQYRVRRSSPSRSLLEVRIETGRKNQIRAHLSEIGCPIVGDRKYGARSDPIHRLGLHASLLAFDHPVTGERIRLALPIPGAFRVGPPGPRPA